MTTSAPTPRVGERGRRHVLGFVFNIVQIGLSARIVPSENPPTATRDAEMENPGAPARANPTNTTLPVVFATNTRPSTRKL